MLLPETKGIALPETVDDVEKLGRYRMAFSASVTAAFRPPGEGGTETTEYPGENNVILPHSLSKSEK